MASNRKDSAGYNSIEARAVRGIDLATSGLKAVWQKMSFGRGFGTTAVTAIGIGAASFGVSGIIYSQQDGPIGGTPTAQIDYDLTGDAYAARSYSYVTHEDVSYFLMYDVDHYELYQWNDERRTIDFIPFAVASSIIAEITADYREEIDNFNLNNESSYRGDFRTCDLVREPVERSDGSITRYYSGCKQVNNKNAAEITENYEKNWAFWNTAHETVSEDNYGIDMDDVTRYQPSDRSHIRPYSEIVEDTAQYGFGGWLALGILGAGVTGLRRRADKKQNRPR